MELTKQPIHINGRVTTIAEIWQQCGQDDNAPDYIKAVQTLLWELRLKAMPYEISPNQKNPETEAIEPFMIGAIARTSAGRFYGAANLHQSKEQNRNDCAEALAMNFAQLSEGKNVDIEELSLTGGKAAINNGTIDAIASKYAGARVTPCGHCRDRIDNMSKNSTPIKTRIYPLLSPETDLQPYDASLLHDMPANMIRDYGAWQLLPHKTLEIANDKQLMCDGLALLKQKPDSMQSLRKSSMNTGHVQALDTAEKKLSSSRKPLKIDDLSQLIYERMFNTVRKDIHGKTRKSLDCDNLDEHVISLAVVRTKDGEYFCGRNFESSDKQSMANSIENAIQNTGGYRNITDVFLLQLDMPSLKQQLESPDTSITMPMPRGGGLQFIYKARSNQKDNEGKPLDDSPFNKCGLAQPRLHLFSVVSPSAKIFNAEKHMYSFPLDSLCPDIFVPPKTEKSIETPQKSVSGGTLQGKQHAPEIRI